MSERTHTGGSDVILEARGIEKSFGGIQAVDGIDLSFERGRIEAVIGPNGAGKSTFFKILTGILTPDTGTIIYDGEEITDMERHRRIQRGMSIKFQNVRIYSSMSVKDNLRVSLQRIPGDTDEKAARLLDTVNLSEKAEQKAGELSHGEKQWLEIAMSIAIEPELLLLDEPTAGMTIEETKETGELIEQIVDERGLTVIVVEHDVKFIQQISEWITVLNEGKVLTAGTAEEVMNNPNVQRVYLGK